MLHSINLQPWRDEKREAHKKRFVQMLVLGLFVAAGIQWGIGVYFEQQRTIQQSRLTHLNTYIKQLDDQISQLKLTEQEHKALLTRLSVVEGLQKKRNKTTDLMNIVPGFVPEGVYVDKIKMNGERIEISGISDSTARLATMLDNFETSPLLLDVEMHSIIHGKPRFGKKYQTFKVSFRFNSRQVVAVEENSHG